MVPDLTSRVDCMGDWTRGVVEVKGANEVAAAIGGLVR